MGCSSSSGPSDVKVDLTDFDLNKAVTRQVKDFPFYQTRLRPIDYEAIIAAGQEWTDETFPASQSSLLED